MATGDKLVKLDGLKVAYDNLKQKAYKVSLPTSTWSGSGPYTYTFTASGITTSTNIDYTIDSSINYLNGDLTITPGNGTLVFSTPTLPSGTVNITVTAVGVDASVQVMEWGTTCYSKSQTDALVAQSTAVADGTASFTPGANISTDNTLYIKRMGKMCIVRGNLNISGTVAGSNTVVGTLPEGFRPSQSMYVRFWSTYNNGAGFFSFSVVPAGLIMTATGSNTFSGYIYLDMVFMTA